MLPLHASHSIKGMQRSGERVHSIPPHASAFLTPNPQRCVQALAVGMTSYCSVVVSSCFCFVVCLSVCLCVSNQSDCLFGLSCLVLSCLVLSCLVLSCLVVSCLVLSCLVLSEEKRGEKRKKEEKRGKKRKKEEKI